MIAKKDCTKTVCPLCESQCEAGSTNSSFIENNGACFRCIVGKSKEKVEALLLAKEAKASNLIKVGKFIGIDLSKSKDVGTTAFIYIKPNKFYEFDNCAACQHRKNTAENKFKSPAYFKGYEPNDEFIRNENASFDGGYNEEVIIKKTWQKPDGSAWVTFLSNMRMGFLDMQLSDFAKKYRAKPKSEAPKPISENDTPLSKSKRYFEGVKTNEVVDGTLASDGKRYFYITFSCNGGGKKGYKRGYICIRTFGNKMFSIERVSKDIKEILSFSGKRVKEVLINNWKEVNEIDYNQLTDNENETPCKLL